MFQSIIITLSFVLLSQSALAKASLEQYQVGDQWSRIPYEALTANESLNKVIKATGRIDTPTQSGTAFYVGKYLDRHIMMTNYHVLSDQTECTKGKVYFQYFKRKFSCYRILAKIKDIEATFFAIRVSKKQEVLFQNLAMKFDFKNNYSVGEKLLVAGYGENLNKKRTLTYENSDTCVVATSTSAPIFQTVHNTDGTFNAWTFVHACEISHGDSGSAIISERTGKVIGINWATSSEKPIALLNKNTLWDWIRRQVPELWSSLSWGVPNAAILNSIQANKHPALLEFAYSNQN